MALIVARILMFSHGNPEAWPGLFKLGGLIATVIAFFAANLCYWLFITCVQNWDRTTSHSCTIGWRASPALEPTMHSDQTSAADSPFEVADEVDEAALAQVMRVVPLGAGILAGGAVALLVLGYLAIYLLVFLPRGTVG
jgi:hypothetical protein